MQRLKCREELFKISDLLIQLRKVLLDTAEENADTIIPGYTHMQPAQPITYGHYLSAHASALERDFDRLAAAFRRTNLNPMGAGALAGTGFNINRNLTGSYLAFDADLANTLDAVASRDYAAEIVSALTIMLSTIGRMNQDFYFWITSEFSLIDLPDEFLFSSSINLAQHRHRNLMTLTTSGPGSTFLQETNRNASTHSPVSSLTRKSARI